MSYHQNNQFNIPTQMVSSATVTDYILEKVLRKVKPNHVIKCVFANATFSTKKDLIIGMVKRFTADNFQMLIKGTYTLKDVDANERNFLHYLCLSGVFLLPEPCQLAYKIEILANRGCELDHQDKEGRTPLHYAALVGNARMVTALLSVGADINIVDIYGNTPFTSQRKCIHALFHHMDKLTAAGLYVNHINKRYNSTGVIVDLFEEYRDLSEMESVIIDKKYSLRDILTEKTVMRFTTFPKHLRCAILTCLGSCFVHRKFPNWSPIFNVQRRKLLKRTELFESAVESLKCYHDTYLPTHCVECVLISLHNDDWQNLIASCTSAC